MDSEQRRKRKRMGRSYSEAKHYLSSRRSLFLCFSFFVFLLLLSSGRFRTASFRPVITASSTTLYLISSTAHNSVLDSVAHRNDSPPAKVQDRVLFPDHVLLIAANRFQPQDELDCVYRRFNGSDEVAFAVKPVLSTEAYDEVRSIVRCPLPFGNYSSAVDLRRRGGKHDWTARINSTAAAASPWDKVVYEAVIDDDTAVVFVKGLNLKPHRKSDPTRLTCHFEMGEGFEFTTEAVTAAQEVVRCLLPESISNDPDKASGIRVTIGFNTGRPRAPVHVTLPSVATIHNSKPNLDEATKKKKHELCVCTMLWNQAPALSEWIMYHAWLGVERWFIYDNNSDDGIEDVVLDLDSQGYNVSRQSWPWIKTQEAGFSHCALKAREECTWVGFFDVDEFFYFPREFRRRRRDGVPGENWLGKLVSNFSNSPTIAELRTDCHSFGPSGLRSHPSRGVTTGYTCRLQSPERHKSIVRTDLLDVTLLNVVHHFRLREGFRHLNVPEGIAVINHYKYQVWETFRAKFYRRVATYVVDWQEDQNQGSKDRAPGLGTEAIEPPNWRLRFCEVWDTGLKDFVLAYFADRSTGSLPWERAQHQ
ncbi:putative Glycosyltransferase family 92 [Rosa chinensis]|uniref:Glycosyltransferase family 92 protein n=1 Tax=Rosa chinensis TaxID=74649 RepID=A0A2P6R492_ROSCH|nr:glycosyltransferase family 92 protein RCOM_0530710 [Rosa chinensis]PRQ41256.1 putative Glycosyltransferase family 92 [Rosa chinensis]